MRWRIASTLLPGKLLHRCCCYSCCLPFFSSPPIAFFRMSFFAAFCTQSLFHLPLAERSLHHSKLSHTHTHTYIKPKWISGLSRLRATCVDFPPLFVFICLYVIVVAIPYLFFFSFCCLFAFCSCCCRWNGGQQLCYCARWKKSVLPSSALK